MLACIFKHSRNFGQVNSIKELNRPSTLSAYSYFRQNTVIELLRNVKKLSDIVEEILNKKVDKAFFRYYDSNAIEEGDDDCDNDNLYYINGCISFATQFEDKIFSVLGGK
jgi:hypothetical protein